MPEPLFNRLDHSVKLLSRVEIYRYKLDPLQYATTELNPMILLETRKLEVLEIQKNGLVQLLFPPIEEIKSRA